MSSFSHFSVLLGESVGLLGVRPDGVYVDCTLGGGGHAQMIASQLSEKGRLIGIDRDPEAIAASKERLSRFGDKIIYVNGNFVELSRIVSENGFEKVDGVIMDLGVSSHQLDTPERGFSYHADAPLDMRMDQTAALSAKDVVNGYSREELTRVIRDYGEEHRAAQISRAICSRREEKPIETTLELAEIIKSVFPPAERFENKHPARRTFQAIRIEVNGELDVIPSAIDQAAALLKKGGVISVISFHSLEDRAVKEAFRKHTDGCTCPRSFPVCVCGFKPDLEIITKKPVLPGEEENELNSRSRSAKLRAARKI
ncbi:MAG: 16S rRNA (cytosine(1402)-N(4))-methyltransferase RsmH [Clostridia bacterium]|nr:16S rRNA (cytosine(1402)-N(4))-methyltransferase RsmH [Clostridia bacterium]